MRRVDWTACIAIVLVSMASAAFAESRVSEPKIVAETVRDDVFPKLQAHYPNGVVARGGVEFANLTGFRPLQLDLYTPRPIKGGAPLVVWVHGGGWNRGDSRTAGGFADFPAVLASVAARGFGVASVNYRLSGEARIADQVRDIKSAVRFLRAHAADYGLDPARVYLVGGSAGGQLAALAATTCGVPLFDPPASTGRLPGSQARTAKPLPVSDCVQGAVAWFGPFDMSRPGSLKVEQVLGCAGADCSAAAAAASPATYLDGDDPPMLLLHGAADDQVSPEQTLVFADRLRAAGVPADTAILPGVGHGWIGPDLASTRAASLDALRRTLDFLQAQARR
ncbi:alpha/beta fold hydrolase [Caulobacter sp. UC70_42]|uniref:alpha/beta fold hydrolase n=1 Tax=Caulobacter sp. UC70_42 TaxID=3374551 RepID=UPI00375833A7